MKKIQISPSILSADFSRLGEEIKKLEEGGADLIHVDVMDGHFVPNLTFGPPLLKELKKITKIPFDVHLMVTNPDSVYSWYLDAGASWLSFHVEASSSPFKIIEDTQKRNSKAGLAISPQTPLSVLDPFLPVIDFIIIMGVNPGFSGQKFLPRTINRVEKIRENLEKISRSQEVTITVDGGVSHHNIKSLVESGASCFVSGSYLFNSPDRLKALQSLRAISKS